MIRCRVADPSERVAVEGEILFSKWEKDDEGLSWWDYLEEHASEEAREYMKEIREAQEDAERRGVLI